MALHLSYYLPHIKQGPTHNNALQRSLYNNARTTHKVKCSVNTQVSQSTDQRRSANYQPSIWSYNHLQSLQTRHADEEYKNRAKKLEEEVRFMINNEGAARLSILELIDDIQRLGLGHRFEEEIKRALDRVESCEGYDVKAEEKLHAVALRFRLLRQNGYQASQDVFKIFMDDEGKFMAHLQNDVKGMLSLYEASYLGFEGENILDEALNFSKKHLNEVIKRKKVDDTVLPELVSHSLELPLHRRMRRLEARWYIDYSQDKRKDANRLLLELAKLDFNMVQSILQNDLKDVTRWWTGIDLANKLAFARDRLMESFFWTVGMAPDARSSNFCQGITKVAAFITILDDVYDIYGTLDELELFTEAVERWDVNLVNKLPPYMKLCFMALYNTVNGMAYDFLKEHGENILPYLTEAWAILCKAFLQEANWFYNKCTPTFNDYLENAWKSSSGPLFLVHSYFLVPQSITEESLESLENLHNLLRWPSVIFRLCNDLATSTDEIERGETAGAIRCYMSEAGVSEELAREHLRNLIDESWKNMNKDLVNHDNHPFAEPFVETAINLARIAHCTYQYGDGHGAPDARAKKRVLSLIIEPVPLMERQEHYHS